MLWYVGTHSNRRFVIDGHKAHVGIDPTHDQSHSCGIGSHKEMIITWQANLLIVLGCTNKQMKCCVAWKELSSILYSHGLQNMSISDL